MAAAAADDEEQHPWIEDPSAPLGNRPYIDVLLTPVTPDTRCPAEGFEVQMNARVPLGEVRRGLCIRLGLPDNAVKLMHAGKDCEDKQAMAENGITLPGPMARKQGAKVQIRFDLVQDVLETMARRQRTVREEEEKAIQMEKMKLMEEEQRRLAFEREEEERQKPEDDLMEFVWRKIGMQQQQVEEEQATNPEFVAPPNVFEPCGEEIRAAIEQLMNETGGGGKAYKVACVVRNVQPTLKRRYERVRGQLQDNARIERHETATAKGVKAMPDVYSCLGDYDGNVNEFPMWHGTTSAEAASGICKTGFDIAHAGSACGSAFSPGFYFAENSGVSDRYTKGGWYVNSAYPSLKAMLLCRVVCGNLHKVTSPPNEQEKERLTALCLGPGGSFGAGSDFHTVLGGGWAYVAMHRDQVYPEYVAIYS